MRRVLRVIRQETLRKTVERMERMTPDEQGRAAKNAARFDRMMCWLIGDGERPRTIVTPAAVSELEAMGTEDAGHGWLAGSPRCPEHRLPEPCAECERYCS